MGDVKGTDHHPLDFFEMHSPTFDTNNQLSDESDNNYPKLLARLSDFEDSQDSSPTYESEQNNLFSPEKVDAPIQAPDEEDVVSHFLLSISTSFKEEEPSGELRQSPKEEDLGETVGADRVLIDTAAPFESVKAAVSKFGGIVDWKAHRVQTVERRKLIEQELAQAQNEIPIYKTHYQEAEASKARLLKELDSTKRLVEELKLNLERAQLEDQQAKQDAELVKLRVEELEQGIEGEASVSAKTQLEVARSRHVAAKNELKTVKNELEQMKKDYELLVLERERAVKKAELSVSACKEADKLVEEMTIELIDVKESLGLAHGAHLEAEEEKIESDADKEIEKLNCEKELKEAVAEIEKLETNIIVKNDKKKILGAKMSLLAEVKSELAAYVETKSGADSEKEVLIKELEDVKMDIGKAFIEINSLKMEEASLRLDIERERSDIYAIKKNEETAKALVSSLEKELRETRAAISSIRTKAIDTRERMTELPMQLQVAGQELDEAKTLAQSACEEMQMQKNDTKQAKAKTKTVESKLVAVQKDIEDAKASEKLALEAINFVKDSDDDSNLQEGIISLSLEEYYRLNKRAHEAQEQANALIASVESQIEIAKESESKTLRKLEEVGMEMEAQKEALVVAIHKAENAKEEKLNAEQELRVWRSENGQKRKDFVQESRNPRLSFENSNSNLSNNFISMAHTVLPQKANVYENGMENDASADVKGGKKKKKFFPRIFMFLARRKANANKSK